MKELTLDAVTESVEKITEFVNMYLESVGCPPKTKIQFDIAVDEIVSNIVNYAYVPGTGTIKVMIETIEESGDIVLTFMDHGRAFNPLMQEDPDTSSSAAERKIGGLGIFVVKKSMDEVSYSYENGKNVLKLRKRLIAEEY